MIDMEIALVNRFGWNLRDIVETDIADLIPFIIRFTKGENGSELPMAYIDQLEDWA